MPLVYLFIQRRRVDVSQFRKFLPTPLQTFSHQVLILPSQLVSMWRLSLVLEILVQR